MNIEIVREAKDRLSIEVWTFYLIFDNFRLVLNKYRRGSRPTTRHKYRHDEVGYDRFNGRDSTIREADVPWPDDVVAEARAHCLAEINAKLHVGRWNADFGL